jgi:predicted CoA-binding protein
MKKTVVIGATDNPERYAFLAANRLMEYGHHIVLVGIKPGSINGQEIQLDKPAIDEVDTVTLYVGPKNQPFWYEYILSLYPKRIIFNPGTENPEFEERAQKAGIEVVEGCTLVMLSIGNY